MALSDKAKRKLWIAFLVCVGILALTAVAPFASPRLGSLEESILGTVALVAGVALLVFAGIVNWRPSMRIPCVLGFIAALATLICTLSVVWYRPLFLNPTTGSYGSFSDLYRVAMLSWTLAVAFPLDGLLSLARLPGALVWVRHATSFCLWVLAVVLIYLTFERPIWSLSEYTLFRLVATLTIAGLFGAIAVVVLHKRYAIRIPVRAPLAEQRISLNCPGCGRTQKVPIGQSTCPSCRLVFRIEVEAPTCEKCGYMLFQLTSEVCPECGTSTRTVGVEEQWGSGVAP